MRAPLYTREKNIVKTIMAAEPRLVKPQDVTATSDRRTARR
jgi:hypothetical protein